MLVLRLKVVSLAAPLVVHFLGAMNFAGINAATVRFKQTSIECDGIISKRVIKIILLPDEERVPVEMVSRLAYGSRVDGLTTRSTRQQIV
jgi:hypothetical protein